MEDGAKKKSLYDITDDFRAILRLMENAVDEDGNPRDLNEEETDFLIKELSETEDAFRSKADGYCKLLKNLSLDAENCEAERKNFKAEMDRLSKRAKTAENRAKSLKSAMQYAMEVFKLPKLKTGLFSLGIQSTAMSVYALAGAALDKVPEKFLKPRELDTAAIKEAVKSGELVACPESENPLEFGRVYLAESGEMLEGVRCRKGSTLVIR
ncbi:MAG: siphovirus Gp157 family protein [Lachnospiraceae bacterium]|nr:siphovirus Gp157 family protein [Lachnospiraceae bacterium]